MWIRFNMVAGTDRGWLMVERRGDKRARASGYTHNVHGWGAEIHLLHMIMVNLNRNGFRLAKIKVSADGHLMGDEHMVYLRPPLSALKQGELSYPLIVIIDEDYAIRSSAKYYNRGETARFTIYGNFSTKWPQPTWKEKVVVLCRDAHPYGSFEYEIR